VNFQVPAKNGSIFDRLDQHKIRWRNYYTDLPATAIIPGTITIPRQQRGDFVKIDQFYSDAMRDHASDYGVTLLVDGVMGEEETKRYLFLRDRVADNTIDLSTDAHFRTDLQRIRRRTTQAGMRAHLPKTSDGRHCDFGAALVLSLVPYLPDVKEPPPGYETSEWYRREAERMKRAARNEVRQRRRAA